VIVGAPQINDHEGRRNRQHHRRHRRRRIGHCDDNRVALVLDSADVANTQIAASATRPRSGPGGSVTAQAGTLTVNGGAQIVSSTAGPARGGDVNVSSLQNSCCGIAGRKSPPGRPAVATPGRSPSPRFGY